MAKRILVIEDDRDIRESIQYALEEEGYDVTTSEDSKILKSLSKIAPDLMLLDNWLTEWKSDINGQQICRDIKSNSATSHIPVIMISAVSNIQEIAKGALADGYLHKPFDLQELLALVKKHVDK